MVPRGASAHHAVDCVGSWRSPHRCIRDAWEASEGGGEVHPVRKQVSREPSTWSVSAYNHLPSDDGQSSTERGQMSTRINTNVSSLSAHRNVVRNQEALGKTLERLASGLKINRGADAPAQLQISEQLRAQSAGLNQAIDNSEMAVSLMLSRTGCSAGEDGVVQSLEGWRAGFLENRIISSKRQESENSGSIVWKIMFFR